MRLMTTSKAAIRAVRKKRDDTVRGGGGEG
jgi:hypothetical protein